MLPPGLLDFTLSRATASSQVHCFRRSLASIAAAAHTRPPANEVALFTEATDAQDDNDYFWKTPKRQSWAEMRLEQKSRNPGALRSRQRPSTSLSARSGRSGNVRPDAELALRVKELEDLTTNLEVETVLQEPEVSEDELMSLYENVMALPPVEDKVPTLPSEAESTIQLALQEEADMLLLAQTDYRLRLRIQSRLADPRQTASGSSFSTALRTMRDDSGVSIPGDLQWNSIKSEPRHRRVLLCAQALVKEMEHSAAVLSFNSSVAPEVRRIHISPLSNAEFETLARVSIQKADGEAAEMVLDLMKRLRKDVSEDAINSVLEMYANAGQVSKTEAFFVRFIQNTPTPRQRHLHIKAHTRATAPSTIPVSALNVLHHYESTALPAPLKSYSTLIATLLSTHTATARAHAWDLYAHMRYAAHPKPDAFMYTQMMRACASSTVSPRAEPERALDLWTEMTVDRGMEPTAGAYAAVILACATDGRKVYVNEAFRLAKEMLEGRVDARGRGAFGPGKRVFCAMLEGAKRIGDLARARWILAEMVRTATEGDAGGEGEGVVVDEEVMMHVFHTYASYKPPFKRSMAPDEKVDESKTTTEEVEAETVPEVPVTIQQPTFTHLPPQSRSEVIQEIKALFLRILQDTGINPLSAVDPAQVMAAPPKKFAHVQFTARLLNAYLSVHYKHASLRDSWELFDGLIEQVGGGASGRNAHTYVDALEVCAATKRGKERAVAAEFSDAVWEEWVGVEHKGEIDGMTPRLVERAHVARIRTLALMRKTDAALRHVKDFMRQYKPDDLKTVMPKPTFRSSRTLLEGSRPLVRLVSGAEVPDETVPPLLTFADLDVLHHRLVDEKNHKGLAVIKYACTAYEYALRERRDRTMKAEPAKIGK